MKRPKLPRLVSLLVLTAILAWPSTSTWAALRAGASAVDITPVVWPLGLIGNFGFRPAESAHDPLHARAVVLDDGRTRLAMVVVDSCYIPREVLDAAKERAAEASGMPAGRMLVSATHTHSAPSSMVYNGTEEEEVYQDYLIEKIAEAIVTASKALQPAEVGWASADLPEEVFNRRWFLKPGTIPANPFGDTDEAVKMNPGSGPNLINPAGPTDPQVWVLSARTPKGQPIALLANYSLHYVGGVPGGQVSADYFGEFARLMKTRLAGERPAEGFTAILSNGTSGDINNINFKNRRPRREPFEQIRIVASKVADAAYEAYREIEHRGDLKLGMVERELTLGWRVPSGRQLEWARATLKVKDEKNLPRLAKAYAQRVLKQADHPPAVDIKLQALRIGELGIAAIPFEVFAEIGLELKDKMPLPAGFTIELANGAYGYLPTPEHHQLGGYETWLTTNRVEPEASRKIVNTLLGMFGELK